MHICIYIYTHTRTDTDTCAYTFTYTGILQGLDHAGHVSGAESALMRSKQAEMDKMISSIHAKVKEQSASEEFRPTVLVVCSDHGMNSQGNHGGSSEPESDAVALFFPDLLTKRDQHAQDKKGAQTRGKLPQSRDEEEARAYGVPFPIVWQVDMAPTLALLMGLDIPHQSIGHVLPRTLDHFAPKNFLRALDKNSLQLSRLLSEGNSMGTLDAAAMADKLANARDAGRKCLRIVHEMRVTVQQLRDEVWEICNICCIYRRFVLCVVTSTTFFIYMCNKIHDQFFIYV
jgi:hypothetical protein